MPVKSATLVPIFSAKALMLTVLLAPVFSLTGYAQNTSFSTSAADACQTLDACRKAAEQGDAKAQNHLGMMYYTGMGMTQDYKQAEFWFRKAATQGDATAQNNLYIMQTI